jgi:hypothetical protein
MKKILLFALMNTFALAITFCSSDATERIDKTEYTVVILVEEYNSGKNNTGVENAEITLLDYDKTYATDKNGKATLTLQWGTYRMTVKKDGYEYYDAYSSDDFDGEEYLTLRISGNDVEKITLISSRKSEIEKCIVRIICTDGSKVASIVYADPVEKSKAPTGSVIGADYIWKGGVYVCE